MIGKFLPGPRDALCIANQQGVSFLDRIAMPQPVQWWVSSTADTNFQSPASPEFSSETPPGAAIGHNSAAPLTRIGGSQVVDLERPLE